MGRENGWGRGGGDVLRMQPAKRQRLPLFCWRERERFGWQAWFRCLCHIVDPCKPNCQQIKLINLVPIQTRQFVTKKLLKACQWMDEINYVMNPINTQDSGSFIVCPLIEAIHDLHCCMLIMHISNNTIKMVNKMLSVIFIYYTVYNFRVSLAFDCYKLKLNVYILLVRYLILPLSKKII